MTYQQLTELLQATKEQIRAFDNKAQILLGVNGVLLGFVAAEIAKAAEYGASEIPKRFLAICIILAVAFIAACVSIAFALLVIHPLLQLGQPNSKIFFCHLARDYERDYMRAARDFIGLGETKLNLDIGAQIQVNAVVCNAKSMHSRRSLWCAGVALLPYACSLPVFCSMAYTSASRTKQQPLCVPEKTSSEVQPHKAMGASPKP